MALGVWWLSWNFRPPSWIYNVLSDESNSCLPYFDTYQMSQYLLILHVKRQSLAWLQLATGLHIYINQRISIWASRWLQLRPAVCNTGRTPGPAWVTICAPYCKARQATSGVVESFGVWQHTSSPTVTSACNAISSNFLWRGASVSILTTCCVTEDFCCHHLHHFQFLRMYYLCLWKLKWTMDGHGRSTSPGHLGNMSTNLYVRWDYLVCDHSYCIKQCSQSLITESHYVLIPGWIVV
jgi:hypothetical protein